MGVRHQQQDHPGGLGELGQAQGGRRHRTEHGPHLGLGHQHRAQRRGRSPVGALSGLEDDLGGGAVEQPSSDPLEQSLADPAGRGLLVVVPGDARGGQLVDVGEDQLGELDEHEPVDAVAHGRRGELAPRDPSADPVRRQQRVGRATAASLAPAELVGALDGGSRRGRHVGATASAGQRQEPAERQLHGVADGLAHRPAERVGVARHPVDDLGHHLVGDRRQHRAHLAHRPRGELDRVPGRLPRDPTHHGDLLCCLRTSKWRGFTSLTQDFTPQVEPH
ncbi:unannotated protein [freshwater metagenome]|uniref:Unannotated protein n=1 Tax=freshwater metagenome TaxID=449393 RepID=A0A6J6RUY9_9ZZZZ